MWSRHILIAIALSLPMGASAADISGFVKDPSARPAAGASLTLACPGGVTRGATANAYGRYRIGGLPDLKWCQLSASYQGKQSNSVRVNTGSGSKDINVYLRPHNNSWELAL